MLEVLIAIVILSIAIMGLATLQSRGIRGNDLGNRTSQAVALVQDRLEQLINSGSGTNYPLSVPSPNPFPDANNPIDETSAGGGIFTRTWQLQNDIPINGFQTVTVTVDWVDIAGQHTVSANGVISSDGY